VREDVPDHFRIHNKIKKELRSKKESMYEEELWQDWDQYHEE
jgi:hypothetical protein